MEEFSLNLKVKIANQILDAYSVENCIYEVSYCGRKEFYQDAWDAVHSAFYTKDSSYNATVTKIPVKPISEKRIEERLLYQKWDLKDWNPPQVKEFKQSKAYLFRFRKCFRKCFRKIGLPLLIVMLWGAICLVIFK